MNLDYRGSRYSTLMASDIHRDGVGLELHGHSGGQDQLAAEVFFSDATGSWTVNTFDRDIPLELLEQLIAEAKTRLVGGASH